MTSFSATTPITRFAERVASNIETVNDTDWFKTTLVAGHTYRLDLEGSATSQGLSEKESEEDSVGARS